MENTFRFGLDIDILKGNDTDERRLICGYASTDHQDRQDESLVQKGLDISDFVNHGYFNYDHEKEIILGYPLATCRVDNKGFYVEGELLKGLPMADNIWELAKALKKSSAPRKLGFSVEGKVLARGTNGVILKAKVYNVAITPNPVNTDCTWDILTKSFSSDLSKALEAGYEVDPLKMQGGDTFRKESLDDELRNLSYVIGDEENKKILKRKLSTKKSFTQNELILYYQIAEGWSQSEAKNFISSIK